MGLHSAADQSGRLDLRPRLSSIFGSLRVVDMRLAWVGMSMTMIAVALVLKTRRQIVFKNRGMPNNPKHAVAALLEVAPNPANQEARLTPDGIRPRCRRI
jgi:hypothetical protein